MCIAAYVGGWQLSGVALYWGILFEITQEISVPRLPWACMRLWYVEGWGLAVHGRKTCKRK
jgi:hypothetical protein